MRTDESLRRAERNYLADPRPETHAHWLNQRLRSEDIERQSIFLAAMCQHPAALLLMPDVLPIGKWAWAWDFVKDADINMPTRVCLAACEEAYTIWNLDTKPEYPTQWIRQNGGDVQWTMDENNLCINASMTIVVDGIKFSSTSSVSMREFRRAYPNFDEGHSCWSTMCDNLRKTMFEKGVHIPMNDEIVTAMDLVRSFLAGDVSRFVFQTHINEQTGAAQSVPWLWSLLHVTYRDIQISYGSCLSSCSYITDCDPAINRSIAEWALK